MRTENKQYRLKRWYPSLAISWRTGDRYEYDAGRRVMTNISNVKNGLAMPKEMVVKEQEIHSDFWELIEEKEPLFITDDGIKITEHRTAIILVDADFIKHYKPAIDCNINTVVATTKLFFHESNADEYIWKNKPLFSYEDFMKWGNVPYERAIEQLAKERIEG